MKYTKGSVNRQKLSLCKSKLFVSVLIILSIFLTGCGMDSLPEGELINSEKSPDGIYIVNAYLCSGNATTDFSVRCEAVEISTRKTRNIYWQYHQDDVDIRWKDNKTVIIAGNIESSYKEITLDVTKESYDWRDN